MEQNFPNRSHVFCVFCQMCNFIASNKCETKTKVKHPKHLKHPKHPKHPKSEFSKQNQAHFWSKSKCMMLHHSHITSNHTNSKTFNAKISTSP